MAIRAPDGAKKNYIIIVISSQNSIPVAMLISKPWIKSCWPCIMLQLPQSIRLLRMRLDGLCCIGILCVVCVVIFGSQLQLKCLKIGNIEHRGLLHHLLLNSGEIDAENLSPNWTWLLSILPNNTQLLLHSSKSPFQSHD